MSRSKWSSPNRLLPITKADKERDIYLKDLLSFLKPYSSSRDTTEKEACSLLKVIFNNYRKTSAVNHETETAEINYLLEQLKDNVAKAITDLDINRFAAHLTASQQVFLERYNHRSTSEATKIVYDVKTIRQELQASNYQDFVDLVEIYNRRQKDKDYQALIRVLNASRKIYADILAHRKSPKKEETETIPEINDK